MKNKNLISSIELKTVNKSILNKITGGGDGSAIYGAQAANGVVIVTTSGSGGN